MNMMVIKECEYFNVNHTFHSVFTCITFSKVSNRQRNKNRARHKNPEDLRNPESSVMENDEVILCITKSLYNYNI